MKLVIVGATGLVGRKMLEVLKESNIKVDELFLVASERSVGKEIEFDDVKYTCISLDEAIQKQPDIAIFSAGGPVSKEWAPKFAKSGTYVIDNSSAWRMEEGIPLVIPEVNAHTLTKETKIIANPNCSTIQLMIAIHAIHREYGINRMIVSTYQSVSGSGKSALDQLYGEREGRQDVVRKYPHPIDMNCLPHCDDFGDDDYTKEELKLMRESKKILENDELKVTATAVRVPVVGGHSESVNLELNRGFDLKEIKSLLASSDGLILQDNPSKLEYPMPLNAKDKNEVFVGRIRRDHSIENGLNMWVVADNLRKGAATNAIQIAEYLIENKFV